ATMHRAPNAQGGGNRQRRIRVYLNRRIEPRELRAATESIPEVLEEQFPPSVLETDRDQLRRARVGQGKFREQLLERYEGECPITGIREHELLIASHIKPWSVSSNEERLSTDNGILLSALVDRLFDKNLISFSDDGGVLISPRLSDYDRVKCGTAHWAAIQVFPGQQRYLRYHRRVWADLNAL
ncbi:MAG: HNH endonuclease, partial [Planctomycetota bacterium]